MISIAFSGPLPPALAALPQALPGAGLAPAAHPRLLLTLQDSAADAIGAAQAFADQAFADQDAADAVIVHLLPREDGGWARAREAALLWAWVRHAARVFGPRGLRVNALALGGVPPSTPDQSGLQAGRAAAPVPAAPAGMDDIARTLAAFCALRSMTGQMIRLGGAA